MSGEKGKEKGFIDKAVSWLNEPVDIHGTIDGIKNWLNEPIKLGETRPKKSTPPSHDSRPKNTQLKPKIQTDDSSENKDSIRNKTKQDSEFPSVTLGAPIKGRFGQFLEYFKNAPMSVSEDEKDEAIREFHERLGKTALYKTLAPHIEKIGNLNNPSPAHSQKSIIPASPSVSEQGPHDPSSGISSSPAVKQEPDRPILKKNVKNREKPASPTEKIRTDKKILRKIGRIALKLALIGAITTLPGDTTQGTSINDSGDNAIDVGDDTLAKKPNSPSDFSNLLNSEYIPYEIFSSTDAETAYYPTNTGGETTTPALNLTFYNQHKSPNVVIGSGNMTDNGCVPTAGAMLLSGYGYSITPLELGLRLYETGNFNRDYGHGGTDLCWYDIAELAHLNCWGIYDYNSFVAALQSGATVACHIYYGKGSTHAVLATGYDSGNTTVYDPAREGTYTKPISQLWEQRSNETVDTLSGTSIIAIEKGNGHDSLSLK